MASKEVEPTEMEAQESLLYSARHGELKVVKALLEAMREGKITLDINCKGKSKSNLGWTPLHLATYFGHKDVVEALLDAGVNVDEVNDTGDTALHKASFIGNEELVVSLLSHQADMCIMNGEGRTACDVSKTRDVRALLEAARRAGRLQQERRLLSAAKEGDVDEIQALLTCANPPNINCVDSQGNTCLHGAAYRGQARAAVLLLQNGIDTTLRNHSGQLAIDLSRDAEMRSLLGVRPVQRLRRSAARFDGPLLKRSRFLGWRPVWVVLQRGVLLYYGSRAAAAREARWRARRYLDGATLTAPTTEPAALLLAFSDGDTHRLQLRDPADRQAWVTALGEHIAYSEHYLWAGAKKDKEIADDMQPDDDKPLGSMQDALTAATNSLSLLETQLRECAAILNALDCSAHLANTLQHSAYMRFQHAVGSGQEALSSLRHAAALVTQAREQDRATLLQQMERNRVLEESLSALARTHHALEVSVAEELTNSKRKKKSSASNNEDKDDFFDVFEDSDEDATLVSGGLSPLSACSTPELTRRTPIGSDNQDDVPPTLEWRDVRLSSLSHTARSPGSVTSSLTSSLHTALSPCSSRGTLVSAGGHVYRNARPYARHSHSSQWSL